MKTPSGIRILELRLAGFRAFESVRLRLDDLTVLVGRNGAGKSTIIDALEFIRDALTDSLENALTRRGGLSAILHRGSKTVQDLSVAITFHMPASYVKAFTKRTGLMLRNRELYAGSFATYGFRVGASRDARAFASRTRASGSLLLSPISPRSLPKQESSTDSSTMRGSVFPPMRRRIPSSNFSWRP